MTSRIPLLVTVTTLAGCADMSGLGGTDKFACKAPEGVHCESLSGTYYNSLANNLPAQQHRGVSTGRQKNGADSKSGTQHPIAAPTRTSLSTGTLRVPGREMRIWIKAWQDDDKDLADQSYVYLMVTHSHWRIGHVQQKERSKFARVLPPQPTPTPKQPEDVPSAPLPGPSPMQPPVPAVPIEPEK